MALPYDASHRGWTQGSAHGALCLTDKFELLKDIGDGSFGTVALARVRNAGSHIARRGTLIAIKTMKKTFDSFATCLAVREVIFLRTIPNHVHLVPALDIFLDPTTRQLHIAMEYMDGNLYQLMKARHHKQFDTGTVKSILYQILLGLEHIHGNGYFHRDIKPENVLVSLTAKDDLGSTLNRYSRLLTPQSGAPGAPWYSIKLADFGLARELSAKQPYTTYVSTRWYRAPEVLLRSGYYSAPVDIWAMGAMAIEIATLRPVFPGATEVDQIWRISEIMGNPGTWLTNGNLQVGGGEWKDGEKLAHGLGFRFPKMIPRTVDSVLHEPEWPIALSDWVTWCLMWDPKNRPTADECLKHEYFTDAVDPLRPKSSSSRLHLGRKQSDRSVSSTDTTETFSKRTSTWLRKSLVTRDSAPAVTQHVATTQGNAPTVSKTIESILIPRRPIPAKRHTHAAGTSSSVAPMPILPCIKPISPLPNIITVQAQGSSPIDEFMGTKKLTRQLSMASCASQHADARQEADSALYGTSPAAALPKEGFFSHLRKKARRISGRYVSAGDDVEANAGSGRWPNNKYATIGAGQDALDPSTNPDFADLDKKLQTVKQNLEAVFKAPSNTLPRKPLQQSKSNPMLNTTRPKPFKWGTQRDLSPDNNGYTLQNPLNPRNSPIEADSIGIAITTAHAAAMDLDKRNEATNAMSVNPRNYDTPLLDSALKNMTVTAPYPTPLHTGASGGGATVGFGAYGKGVDIADNSIQAKRNAAMDPFPTPPDDHEWAQAAAASIFAVGNYWA